MMPDLAHVLERLAHLYAATVTTAALVVPLLVVVLIAVHAWRSAPGRA